MQSSKVCSSCNKGTLKGIKQASDSKPEWLRDHDYVQEFISKQKTFKICHQSKKITSEIKLNLGKKFANKMILYWAAKPTKKSSLKIQTAKKAYGNFSNFGVAITDSSGAAIIYLKCPQPYKASYKNKSDDISYFRHLHFVTANQDQTAWLKTVYTKIYNCKVDKQFVAKAIKSGNYVVINSLPAEYYCISHIPNSYNLSYKKIPNMSIKETKEWFQKVIQANYPKLQKMISSSKIELHEVPIIVYCAHDKCNASELCATSLNQKGFINIYEYSGGMKDWGIDM